MQMVFSNNGTGKRPAPPLIKPFIQPENVQVPVQTPIMNSYIILNNQGMLQRVQPTSNCKSCGK